MLVIGILVGSALALGAWVFLARVLAPAGNALRGRPGATSSEVAIRPRDATSAAPPPAVDVTVIQRANRLAADRLWKLAFTTPLQVQAPGVVIARMRNNIEAILLVDTVDPNYFPRRPALLPQLLQAVDDPTVRSDRLSRMIAHDPVLTADVLRLANSSLYRRSSTPIETIQRAIVVCGVEALRGMLAAALLRPVFRATRKNFPRLPRMLWERTELASRAAELYAMETQPQDRFEAQLVVLLSALGPLVVYGAAQDVFARNSHLAPSGELCAELIGSLASQMSLRIAQDWQTSARLLAALQGSTAEPLTTALQFGELMGTLCFLESQTVISREERLEAIAAAGVSGESTTRVWAGLSAAA
jgi:HD-like signal output (HDOD) protein